MRTGSHAVPAAWLSTPRIAMRDFVPADFDDLYRLDSDPRVMRFLNDGQPLTRAEVRDSLAGILHDYPYYPGLGIWRAERCDNGAFVGWFCLKYCPCTCDVEIGYRLMADMWGQGLATEGASGLIAHAFGNLGLFRVIGVTHPDNLASQRVLQKSGLADEGWALYYNRKVRLFAAECTSVTRQHGRSQHAITTASGGGMPLEAALHVRSRSTPRPH